MVSLVRLFGLTIASELPLPGLVDAPDGSPIDVTIRRGTVGPEADLVIPKAGSFAVRDGREIVVDALPGIPERNVRLFLLGSAMGLLLHQCGLFPLHANAVALDGMAIAVAGATGAGKSTLAAWFSRLGLGLVGDDVIALKPTDEGMVALPGPPRVRLWRQSLDTFGLGSDGLEPSYVDPDFDKWDVPVALSGHEIEELPLGCVYVLGDGPGIGIRRLGGAAAAEALFDHTYRGGYVEQVGGAAGHWQAVARIAASVPVFSLERPRDLSQLDALGRALLDHARAATARTGGAGR
ncbi:phosphoenolpyruvate carboxykinase (ATP) [Sphingomonas glaciei]|uniref:HPr kinase/phosphorylase C-terminal domain-containing protein n=1 Tax=Sphingomonas glaciei TaxID=2938948 RepID=A0ABY5MWB2_9SPHN|nr:hypothetical protein [Sphingomonas glaciei]UUR08742.1 hypothetical protein M1K48_03660 [Sphingomonas glaciei]